VLGALALLVAAAAVPTAVALFARSEDDAPKGHSAHSLNPHPVAGNFSPDPTQLEDCTPQKPRCYEQAFGNLAFTAGPKRALALFERKMQTDSTVEGGCHRIAHTIGSAALARFHGNVSEAFVQGSSSCWSGYYHGILERAFIDVSSDAELVAAARSVCDDGDIRRTTFLAYQCVHGLGHGLMIHSGYNLPYSLRVCDRLATAWDQTSCTGGVFMENIASTYGVRSRWLRDDDPVYPCDVVKERHKLYCYLMVTSRVNQENGYDWQKTAAVCRGVERSWVRTCFESFGRDASGLTRQSPLQAARLCALAGSFAASCFYGAARDMTSNYANGARASALCARARGPARARCFYGIGTILGNIAASAEQRRALCRDAAAGSTLGACLAGARVRAQGVVQAPS
jgi:hypothetical protein